MILTINGGSSSIKFSFFTTALEPKIKGKIDRMGLASPHLTYTEYPSGYETTSDMPASGLEQAANSFADWLEKLHGFHEIQAIGHRIVNGMEYDQPVRVDDHFLARLKELCQYDPDHLPQELLLMQILRHRHPDIPQIACFDTSFHAGLPKVARIFPVPRRFYEAGIRRYGFHGLSYTYLMHKLPDLAGDGVANSRIILAHLGSGASLTAVKDGKSIDTSMGFTPAGGIMMGTRPGDLDPGAVWAMIQKEQLSPQQLNDLINHESGLLGVSETSSDLRDLLKKEPADPRAAEAIQLFCYQVKKWIGAFSAVLGGLDLLVFTGGIGENSAVIRSRICQGLEYLGIRLDENRNGNGEALISMEKTAVKTYVIPTDEEWMIASTVAELMNLKK
jgi:acetate kinase